MLNLNELEQFVLFADLGTLSAAAEQLHISQPTLTRTMRRVEEAFGVPLFHRGKNRIALNENGLLAADYARKLLFEAEKAVQAVQSFDRSRRTIEVFSCAPAPLWSLLPELTRLWPEFTIASRLGETEEVLQAVQSGQCALGILPEAVSDPDLEDLTYAEEQLYVCVPEGHVLAENDQLTFHQINGFNCLLRDQIGFWTGLCRREMPASRFLIQTDEFSFLELARTSTLLCFTTNLAESRLERLSGRIPIHLTDPAANVTYHLICRRENRRLLETLK